MDMDCWILKDSGRISCDLEYAKKKYGCNFWPRFSEASEIELTCLAHYEIFSFKITLLKHS